MGVDIIFEGNVVIIWGVDYFVGVLVMVIDFWVLVSLVIVGLVVDGDIIVDWIYYIDCGYECIEEKL